MATSTVKEWLNLFLIPGVGSTIFLKLIARFSSPKEVLNASESALSEVVGKTYAHKIYHYRDSVNVDDELRKTEKHNVKLITLDDRDYPLSLAELYDPPIVLYVKGELKPTDLYSISIVGTRNCSPYGTKVTDFFARGLAQVGFTIVSGLAIGVDGIAHKSALEAGGRTIAFLGSGIDVIYPSKHKELYDDIQKNGAIISTFPMGTKPLGNNFPVRNRFISGFSLGTIVTEATLTSGALITAKHAVEQGKAVFAVPGPIGYPGSEGPHWLINQGAKLIEKITDVIEEIPTYANQYLKDTNITSEPIQLPLSAGIKIIEDPPSHKSSSDSPQKITQFKKIPPTTKEKPTSGEKLKTIQNISADEAKVLSVLSPTGSYVDEVALSCNIPISEALSLLTMMEMKGLVKQFSGKKFVRA